MVRQLLPEPAEGVDPLELYPRASRVTSLGRPWVMVNMISSADGAIAVDGTSGDLGGPADQAVFAAIRASADWILVASGTVRAERYTIPRGTERSRAERLTTGKAERARIAVVSASLDMALDLPLFADQRPGDDQPVILTGSSTPGGAVARFENVAEVKRLGVSRPTPSAILDELHSRGARVVLAEGGPTFNGQLVDAGIVDELCLTIAPLIAGGASSRIVSASTTDTPLAMDLAHLLEADGLLFARYVNAAHQQV